MKKQDLIAQFNSVINHLKAMKAPLTIVMDNNGSTRGQLYQISKATQEQADRNLSGSVMFIGTASETMKYLQGYRDLIEILTK
jgi:hypothetical protein